MSYADAFKNALSGAENFDPPDGPYQITIVDAGAFEAKSDGREWCKVTLRIDQGEHSGQSFDDFGPAGDHNPVGYSIMMGRLVDYGLDPADIASLGDLDDAMRELIDNKGEIHVGHNDKGFKTISVGRMFTGQSDIPEDKAFPPALKNGERRFEDDVPAAAPAADDDIPY